MEKNQKGLCGGVMHFLPFDKLRDRAWKQICEIPKCDLKNSVRLLCEDFAI